MTAARSKFHWTVEVANKDAESHTEHVEAYWSPDHELTTECVMDAARTAANRRYKRDHMPLSDPVLVTT